MEKSDSLHKDIQDMKSEVNANYSVQTPHSGPSIAKETSRFTTFPFAPTATWSNCIEKTQNMLRGAGGGSGQETAGWFHFHKVATSGRELYASPMDMQPVYYQTGIPEMRGGCYPIPDPRTYPQIPPPATYTDLRPPSQVVNQRFIQCVNHFAPGSRSLPCLLQPSYFGYEYGGPVHGSSDTMLPRVDPCELARSQRYPQHLDWSHVRLGQDQSCYRQPWDYSELAQSFPPTRYQETQSRKTKGFDCQEPKIKDKFGGTSFNYLAAEVSREMHGVIASGGHSLADLLEFCKFVQSFLFTSNALSSPRNQFVREIILSFIHISSAYVHLGSVLLTAEQSGMVPSELEALRASFNLWENSATSVVVALRSLIHSLSDIKLPDHKKSQDPEDQSNYKPDHSSYYSNTDSSFLNFGSSENGFRFTNSTRTQHRTDFNFNQHQFEFKRKYQQSNSTSSSSQKDSSNSAFNSNSTLSHHKNSCLNFKAKSCNQLNVQSSNNGAVGMGKSRTCEQHCGSLDINDYDKPKTENQGMKLFCFNLLNPEKKKNKGKSHCDQEKQEKLISNSKNTKMEELQTTGSRETKDEKGLDETATRSFKQMTLGSDAPVISLPGLDNPNATCLSYLVQTKPDDWSFSVLNTGDKRPFQFLSKDSKNSECKQQCLFNESQLNLKDPAEKPMSSDSEGSTSGPFSKSEHIKTNDDHCDLTEIQLKHKMLDILGFLMTPDIHNQSPSSDEILNEVKRILQESLNRISYLVYTDRYGGVCDMMSAVRNLFHKTRMDYKDNPKVLRLTDDYEATFLDLFKKEFGYSNILLQQITNK